MKRRTLVVLLAFLSVVGLVLSLYLVQHHYALAQESFCDMNAVISCSVVNQSAYAQLFHVPVAFYGVLWFLVFLGLLYLYKKPLARKILLLWSVSGVLFVFYLLYAEWQIGALCPWCTLVHGIVLGILPLTILLYKRKD